MNGVELKRNELLLGVAVLLRRREIYLQLSLFPSSVHTRGFSQGSRPPILLVELDWGEMAMPGENLGYPGSMTCVYTGVFREVYNDGPVRRIRSDG